MRGYTVFHFRTTTLGDSQFVLGLYLACVETQYTSSESYENLIDICTIVNTNLQYLLPKIHCKSSAPDTVTRTHSTVISQNRLAPRVNVQNHFLQHAISKQYDLLPLRSS